MAASAAPAATAVAGTTATINGFKLVRLNWSQVDEIMQYLVKHFIPNEPTARAVRMSSTDGWSMTEAAVRASLQFPYSYALKNEHGEIVAIRLASILERPQSEEMKKCEDDGVFITVKEKGEQCENRSEELATSAAEMLKLISALESRTWDLVPASTKKLLELVIISTHEKYTGRGLMRGLLTFDLAEQKRDGIDGAVSEATAYNSQRLFAKLGFRILYEIKHDKWLDEEGKRIFKCDDQTNSAQLVHQSY